LDSSVASQRHGCGFPEEKAVLGEITIVQLDIPKENDRLRGNSLHLLTHPP
jgi:hypothetical protein